MVSGSPSEAVSVDAGRPTTAEMLPLLPSADVRPMAEVLCARCARHYDTCCRRTDIYVTQRDVERIEQHVGYSGFEEFRAPLDPAYTSDQDDPLWQSRVFRTDGTRRVLKHRNEHDCIFLGSAGCTLPTEVRPLICRLYPYDYNEDGLKPVPASGCPQHLLAPGQTVFDGVGVSHDDARRWHTMLYDELRQEP